MADYAGNACTDDIRLKRLLAEAGLAIPEILLPDPAKACYNKWAVVACDQFTSQKAYWNGVEAYVGDAPSSLRLILPEIFLSDGFAARVGSIHEKMDEYVIGHIFAEPLNGFILTERVFSSDGAYSGHNSGGGARWGLVAAVDLEKYSYEHGAKTLIRSTEATVSDRLPPRMAIRRGAALELPHVLVLIDDESNALIEPLAADAEAGRLEKIYDFELMAGGGHIRGYKVGGLAIEKAAAAIGGLLREASDRLHDETPVRNSPDSGTSLGDPLLFAVGDGNHSLAAAKAYWDEIKSTLPDGAAEGWPARYALVELINLRSEAVVFEPIHRALYDTDINMVFEEARSFFADKDFSAASYGLDADEHSQVYCSGAVADCSSTVADCCGTVADCCGAVADCCGAGFTYNVFYGGGGKALFHIGHPADSLPVAELQQFLDHLCARHPGIKIDYIHGIGELTRLSREEGCVCFELPPVNKDGFFASVIKNGALPRKSFSMGEATDKRYYLEARKIKP